MRKTLVAATLLAFTIGATPAIAGPCKDAKGKFVKCPPAAAAPAKKCRLNGKFASCKTPGAKPI